VARSVGVGAPVALAVRVLEAAIALRRARRAVPAVDADARRPIADVEAATALAVAGAHVAETHPVRQPFPWKPGHAYAKRRAGRLYDAAGSGRRSDRETIGTLLVTLGWDVRHTTGVGVRESGGATLRGRALDVCSVRDKVQRLILVCVVHQITLTLQLTV